MVNRTGEPGRTPNTFAPLMRGVAGAAGVKIYGATVGGSAWYYISSKTSQALAFQKPQVVDRRIFAVYFDSKKRVERIANYGLEDGQVVDFNNRTTPTAGGDTSFVQNMLQGLLKFSS